MDIDGYFAVLSKYKCVLAMCPKHTDVPTISSIVDLHQMGHSVKEIVDFKKIPRRTVYGILKRFKDGGGRDLPIPKKGPGKKPKIDEKTRRHLRRVVDFDPGTTARMLK